MPFANTNNLTFDEYDFTENYIEVFSRATLQAGRNNGLLEAIFSTKSAANKEGKMAVRFLFPLPDGLIGVALITNDVGAGFKAIVKFFSEHVLTRQIDNGSFDGHTAIAYLEFHFNAFGLDLLERKLETAKLFVLDGSADQMFVAMVKKDDPEAFAA